MDRTVIEEVNLAAVVFAIDGDNVYHGCGLGLPSCSENMPCPVHAQFKGIREDLKIMLETTTMKSLTLGLVRGLTFLKR